MAKEAYVPPPDPDFEKLAHDGYTAFKRDRPTLLSFDTETTGLAHADIPFCVTAAWDGPNGTEAHYFELVKFDSSEQVRDMLSEAALIGHHTKFDLQKCILDGLLDRDSLTVDRVHDTEAQSQLVNEHQRKALKTLMVDVLGWQETIKVEVMSGKRKGQFDDVVKEKYELEQAKKWAKKEYGFDTVKAVGYDFLPRGVLVPYAVMDAKGTHLLFKHFEPLVARYPEVLEKYRQEIELALVLLDMETAGMNLNRPYVKEQIKAYTKACVKHDIMIESIVKKPVGKDTKGGEFNPGSNDQIREFFTALGFERPKYDKANLKTIPHPLADAIINRRKDEKLLGTYFRAMEREVGADGVLRPSFRQHGTVTGRMSSGESEG